MLNFFRKYQKFFFLFTTIIIVITFAFFGSYKAFSPMMGRGQNSSGPDEVAFKAIDGKKIYRSHLNQMVQLLELEAWMQTPKPFDVNFLNEGFVSKQFLAAGFATLLTPSAEELLDRHAREKSFTPYAHPHIKTLTAESIWGVFAPEIPEKLALLQSAEDPVVAFQTRIDLFLAEKCFPSAFLSQVVRYQERENSMVPADTRLKREGPSLFGYRTLSDWFGEQFMEEVCQTVINVAAHAREHGYKVSRQEVMTDLLYRSQLAYNELKERVQLPVHDGYGFLQLYLRNHGLDEAVVVKVWRDVMLFQRFLGEIGDAALTDSLPLKNFYAFAHESATVELYQMAPELRFHSEDDVKKFETYLQAVGDKWDPDADLPLEYASIETIESRAPQLVGKRYRLYVGEVSKQGLQAKVTMKATWDWECGEENWKKIQSKFPELSQKSGTPFEILEGMESKKRKLVDSYAREQIVETHPEWIDFSDVKMDEKELFLTTKTKEPFIGVKDPLKLRELLDEKNEITGYTQDEEHYYRILVCDRSEEKEILTFKEAQTLLEPNVELKTSPGSRFVSYLKKYHESAPEGRLAKQWKIEKKHKTLTRSEPSFISIDEAVAMEPETFSDVLADEGEGAYLYRFLDKTVNTTLPTDKMVQVQQLLAEEARLHTFKNLISCWKTSSP